MSHSSLVTRPAARVALGAVLTVLLLVASHFAFVALYSHVMDPGHDAAYYQEFAQRTGAPFATLLGIYVVFLVARWLIGSCEGSPLALALSLVVAIMLLNALLLLGMGALQEFARAPHLIGETGKLVGALLAVLASRRDEARRVSDLAVV